MFGTNFDPLETRTWITMGIEAAAQAPATREFNVGGVADVKNEAVHRTTLAYCCRV